MVGGIIMTREEAKALLPIIQAYSEGKTIEYLTTGDGWVELEDPEFNYNAGLYRIKPEPTYRPFKNGDECFEEMKRHEPFGWIISRKGEMSNLLYISSNGIVIYQSECRFDCAIIDYVFADGTPFGIKEEYNEDV